MTSIDHPTPPPVRTRATRAAALVGAAALLFVVAAEVGTRIRDQHPPLPSPSDRAFPFGMFRADPEDAGVALAGRVEIPAERFSTNAAGHRDRARDGLPSSTRVAVIGGSTGAGRGVADDQTFCRLLEDILSGAGHSVEIRNLAVPGYGVEQALLRLEADWSIVEPDAVVLAFDEGDTPMRTLLGPGARRVIDGELISGPWLPFRPGADRTPPYEDTRAVLLEGGFELGPIRVYSALRRSLGRNVAGAFVQIPDGMVPFDRHAFGGWGWLWVTPPPDPVDVAWELTGEVLARLQAVTEAAGAELTVLAIPARIDAAPGALEAARGAWDDVGDGVPDIAAGTPGARLRDAVEPLGVRLISAQEALAAAGEPVFYEDLPVLNAAGHREVARLLARSLPGLPETTEADVADALLDAIPVGSAETRFDGGFRPDRVRPAEPVRWEHAANHAW